jgi:hypothetical protein
MLDGSSFSTKAAYNSLHDQQADDITASVWASHVPNKDKIFGWLFHLDRLNTRANLHRKTIINSPSCPRCPNTVEDRQHLFFDCPAARIIWQRAQLQQYLLLRYPNSWNLQSQTHLPASVWPAIFLSTLWRIWDVRNSLKFRDVIVSPSAAISHVIDDLSIWLHRFKNPKQREDVMLWRDHLSACNSQD